MITGEWKPWQSVCRRSGWTTWGYRGKFPETPLLVLLGHKVTIPFSDDLSEHFDSWGTDRVPLWSQNLPYIPQADVALTAVRFSVFFIKRRNEQKCVIKQEWELHPVLVQSVSAGRGQRWSGQGRPAETHCLVLTWFSEAVSEECFYSPLMILVIDNSENSVLPLGLSLNKFDIK